MRLGVHRPDTNRYLMATRLNSFRRAGRSVAEAIRAAAKVEGLSALELNYPQHIDQLEPGELEGLIDETGLRLTALNLRFDGSEFASGAFTSPSAEARRTALGIAYDAVDLAARFDARHVVLWMADDGWDYPLQVDYARLWDAEVSAVRLVADRNPDVRVSIEYKAVEPRRRSLIGSMGEALLAAREVDRPNVGMTLDFCHSLMAGESPAAAAALALRHDRLFGLHLNDGYGVADDGLMVGSVRPAQLLELLIVLRRGGYDGTMYFDTFPVREVPAAECETNIGTLLRFLALAERLDGDELSGILGRHDAVAARRLLGEVGIA